jgi:hypothetical protein
MSDLGIPGSATYAVTLSGIEEMMTVLPDNTANQILASDVRNVVLTLYDDLNGLSASMVNAGVFTFSNPDNTSIVVGGISSGSNLYGKGLQEIFDLMFYPYVAPTLSISVSPSVIEFGNSSQKVNVGWSVIIKKNNVISQSITSPFGTLYSAPISTPNANTTYTGPTLLNQDVTLNTTTTYTFTLSDLNVSNGSGGTKTANANVTWSNRRYWGTLPTSSPLVSVSSATFSHSMISTLSNELNNGYAQTRTITRTTSDYVVFIWPTNVVNLSSTPPVATIGGFGVNAFTKTRSNVAFTNQWGYVTNYDVWRLDTQANDSLQYILT